jgi:DNA polymerase-3 subunit alpha
MSDFSHLHVHTIFSALDGVASPDDYFGVSSEREYPALAITEHGNMASIPDAYWASLKHGVKFIPGAEIYYNNHKDEKRKLESEGKKIKDLPDGYFKDKINKSRHLTVLCKNMTGYGNLLQIRQSAYLDTKTNLYKQPQATFEILDQNREGLIVLSGCMNGPLSFELRHYIEHKRANDNKNDKLAEQRLKDALSIAKNFKELFGDDYYIELQMPGVEDDVELFRQLLRVANGLHIKTVLTNDAHYITADDYFLQKIMMAVGQNTTVDSPDLFISKSRSGYFKTREELYRTFTLGHIDQEEPIPYKQRDVSESDFNAACDNTLEIADKCGRFVPDTSIKLPRIKDDVKVLKALINKGLREKGLSKNKTYVKRAVFELNRIIEKEFTSYFLICRDIVRQSTQKLGMPVGPRGSAGGSLVCYLIGIHEIDPVFWNLPFERFLSSARGGKQLKVYMEDDVERKPK